MAVSRSVEMLCVVIDQGARSLPSWLSVDIAGLRHPYFVFDLDFCSPVEQALHRREEWDGFSGISPDETEDGGGITVAP